MVSLALPAGDFRPAVAELLISAGLEVEGYGEASRAYRLYLAHPDGARVRVFREKDIPIQVALGNYDLGICSLAWVLEMQAMFPEQPIVPLGDLRIGNSVVFAAVHPSWAEGQLASLPVVRVVSEFPNVAEAFARACRFRRYRVQAIWGAAEAYPPEDADVAVFAAGDEDVVRHAGLAPLFRLLDSSFWLIANASSVAGRDLSSVLQPLLSVARPASNGRLRLAGTLPAGATAPPARERSTLRLAVPDGHQQRHAFDALRAAGLTFEGYGETEWSRRPASGVEGLEVKVIRPQDMTQLLATGELDLAITGRDCLNEHLYSFPESPVREAVDLRRGEYNLSVVVSQQLPAGSIGEALDGWRSAGKRTLMLASEFPATADHYARSRHFWRYQVIPIAGASEGFVPEDADLLIEGTETGRTIAENNLKVIDHLYRSTTCVIAAKDPQLSGRRRQLFDELLSALGRAGAQAPL